jgi:outer membrane immunogenic protein
MQNLYSPIHPRQFRKKLLAREGGSLLADISIRKLFMPYSLTTRLIRAALGATFLVPLAGGALAQSADGRSTADIEKENAALRAKVHRLEAEKENIGLRAKVDQLQGRRPVQAATTESAQAAPYPLVTRIETTSPDRTLIMADMPMKAVAPPVPYYSWSGFYLGGNIGYGVGIDRAQSNLAIFTATESSAGTTAVTPAGAIGGVQLGYNWQGGPNWLAGFEADFQGSAQKATSCILGCSFIPGFTTQLLTVTQNLDYFGTVRGRFGFVDRGNLFYVTGGAAYGHVNQTTGLVVSQNNAALSAAASTAETKLGWVVGAGMESSLGGNWTARVEYLYMDLGNTATAVTATAPTGLIAGVPIPISLGASSSLHDNIVRAGLNYRFGQPAAPANAYDAMAAVPPPVFSWTGFYVGANVGYGFGNDHSQVDSFQRGFNFNDSSAPGTSVAPKGGLGGFQLGYNWQASPHWLAGFEADIQGTAQRDVACSSVFCANNVDSGGIASTGLMTVAHQLDYFGTLRGRVGAVFNNSLFYATGGGAFGRVQETLHLDSSGSTPAQFADQSFGKDVFGYAVGGGIEAMLAGGWSAKAEYLYLNLGSISNSFTVNPSSNLATTYTSNSTVRDHIVRIGANYHFGAAPY